MALQRLDRWRQRANQTLAKEPNVRAALLAAGLGLACWPLAGPITAMLVALAVLAGFTLNGSPSAGPLEDAAPAATQPVPSGEPPATRDPPSWRTLVEAMPDPVIAIDEEQHVLDANRAAYDIFPSISRGGLIALASRAPELAEAVTQVLRDRSRRSVRLTERIPVERRLDAQLAWLPGAGPGEPAVLIVLHDISERDRLAQTRADFIAYASHELRTPLTALRGFIETLQGPAKDDAAARDRFLGIMGTEALRMTRLLDDLLSLSRVEMRAHLVPTGQVDVPLILAEVIASLAPLAEKAGTKVTLRGPSQGIIVRGDPDEIKQVFLNLVQNAIKYGRPGGNVGLEISTAAGGHARRLRIAVTDDGPGIAAEHLPRLTERFYRVDVQSSRQKGGTGLGLAIVKHILNRHRGELKILSTLGEGSTFIVDLPLENQE